MLKVEKLLERVDLSSELKSYPMANNADDKRGLHGTKGPGTVLALRHPGNLD